MPFSLASFWNGSVIGPGIGQHARSIHCGAGRPCGGPCSANSGISTSRGDVSLSVAARIRLDAFLMFSRMIDQAPDWSAPLIASLLTVWIQVALQGAIAIGIRLS